MNLCKNFICKVRAIKLYVAFKNIHLAFRCVRLKYINSHLLGYRHTGIHLAYLTLRFSFRILQSIEVSYVSKMFLICNIGKNKLLKFCFFNQLWKQTPCLKTSHRIFYTNTVFNVFNINLTPRRGFGIAIHCIGFTVFLVRKNNLR